jgi:hypothetical protein
MEKIELIAIKEERPSTDTEDSSDEQQIEQIPTPEPKSESKKYILRDKETCVFTFEST